MACGRQRRRCCVSFDTVQRRLENRGTHTAPFAAEFSGAEIASATRDALYCEGSDDDTLCGIPRLRFAEIIYSGDILWAPDGDEDLDDGSYVLQFDIGDDARLIAFRSTGAERLHDVGTLSDLRIPADEFYRVLREWRDGFEARWRDMPKLSVDQEVP